MNNFKKLKRIYDKKRRDYLKNFLPFCLGNCGKRVSDKRYKRCIPCFLKYNTGTTHQFYGKKRLNFSGKNHPFFGKKRPEHSKKMKAMRYWSTHEMSFEMKSKMSLAKGGTGIPHEHNKYPSEFSWKLRKEIRIRDKKLCKGCGISQTKHLKKNHKTLVIHHIDYNKFNCSKSNLISLCIKCNNFANHNRDYWYAYYTYIMENFICQTK